MINFSQFKAQMLRHRPDNFTHRGLRTLYNVLSVYHPCMLESEHIDYVVICLTWEELPYKAVKNRRDCPQWFQVSARKIIARVELRFEA